MKKTRISLTLHTLDSDSVSKDYTQWRLSAGTIARLGKERISDVLNPPEIAYLPDGKIIAVASAIGIWLYDAQTTKDLNLLPGHTLDVTTVSISPDGSILASASGTRPSVCGMCKREHRNPFFYLQNIISCNLSVFPSNPHNSRF